MRKLALDNFKQVRTCVLARELCLLVRTSRPFLNAEDVCDCCSFISKLCREAGCREVSDLCAEAAEAVVKDEKTHLELCEQSCMMCHEGRFPAEPHLETAHPKLFRLRIRDAFSCSSGRRICFWCT